MQLVQYLSDKPDLRRIVTEGLLMLASRGSQADGAPPGSHRAMVNYLWSDATPPATVWADLSARLQDADGDPVALWRAVVDWGRTDSNAFSVVAEALGPACMYAHCVTLEDFTDWLLACRPGLHSSSEAVAWVSSLVDTDDVTLQRDELHAIPLRQYTMWATLNPDDHSGDPLAFLPASAHLLCACLGLRQGYTGKVLLIFRYTLPQGLRPHYPTAASLAAGTPWSEYWQPATPGEAYGHTKPWPEYK